MAVEIKLPELGEGVQTAQVLSVLVKPGDTLRQDQTVIEVETEKATAEVPTDHSGTVSKVLVKEGEQIRVGQTILTLEAAGGVASAAPKAEVAPPKPEPEPAPEPVVEKPAPEPAAEVSPGKPAPAPEPARAEEPAVSAPRKILYLEDQAEPTPPPPGVAVAAAPSVRRLARELGVEIDEVPGSGDGGRISAEDVKHYARHLIARRAAPAEAPRPVAAPQTAPAARRAEPQLPDFSQWGEIEREPMSAIRRATADAMATAWSTMPMVTQFDRADITELETFRKRYGKRVEAAGGKLTVTAIAVRIAAAALKAFPKFNSSIDVANQEIVRKRYVHVGVAVDTERGLMVPVIRNADRKSIVEIATELGELAERARARKIGLEELKGGTFSISNLGGLGTTYFSPIVNWPEVAILGLGRAGVEAVYVDGAFVPRTILPMAVTYDHRLIDGADAARFLRWIAEAMENPLLAMLENA